VSRVDIPASKLAAVINMHRHEPAGAAFADLLRSNGVAVGRRRLPAPEAALVAAYQAADRAAAPAEVHAAAKAKATASVTVHVEALCRQAAGLLEGLHPAQACEPLVVTGSPGSAMDTSVEASPVPKQGAAANNSAADGQATSSGTPPSDPAWSQRLPRLSRLWQVDPATLPVPGVAKAVVDAQLFAQTSAGHALPAHVARAQLEAVIHRARVQVRQALIDARAGVAAQATCVANRAAGQALEASDRQHRNRSRAGQPLHSGPECLLRREVAPNVCVVGRVDSCRIDAHGAVVEFEELKRRMHRLLGSVPLHELLQMHAYLFLTKLEAGVLCEAHGDRRLEHLVRFDRQWWLTKIVPKLTQVGVCVQTLKADKAALDNYLQDPEGYVTSNLPPRCLQAPLSHAFA